MQNPIVEYFKTFSDEFATYEDKSQSAYSFNDWASMLNYAAWSAGVDWHLIARMRPSGFRLALNLRF